MKLCKQLSISQLTSTFLLIAYVMYMLTQLLTMNVAFQLLALSRHAFHCQCNVFITSFSATFSDLIVSRGFYKDIFINISKLRSKLKIKQSNNSI